MDKQTTNSSGYRYPSPEELDLISKVKVQANLTGSMCDELAKCDAVDKRWLAIARTDLQKAFMSLVRAIAKPESF